MPRAAELDPRNCMTTASNGGVARRWTSRKTRTDCSAAADRLPLLVPNESDDSEAWRLRSMAGCGATLGGAKGLTRVRVPAGEDSSKLVAQ